MKRLVAILLLATIAAGCTAKRPLGVIVLPMERLTPQYRDQYTGLTSPARLVVEEARSFEEIWSRAFGTYQPPPPLPDVDFAREVVIVAALGEPSTGGYLIRVTGAIATSAGVLVAVESTAPAGCAVSAAQTQPLDIVKIPRRARTFRFEESSVARRCR